MRNLRSILRRFSCLLAWLKHLMRKSKQKVILGLMNYSYLLRNSSMAWSAVSFHLSFRFKAFERALNDLFLLEKGALAKAQLWTPQEDQILIENYENGPNFAAIAMKINIATNKDTMKGNGPYLYFIYTSQMKFSELHNKISLFSHKSYSEWSRPKRS